jgi:ribosomal protein S18 acetylase RimI-like enzyme
LFVIRRFRPEDLGAVIRLVEAIFNERYEVSMYQNLFQSWPDGFHVVEQDGQVVAFILGMISAPRQARVLLLGVEPRYWGQGLGTQLMWTFMRAAAALPADLVTLELRMSNQRALAFYYRLGFTVTGMIPNYYKDGESAHVMARPLR